MNYRQLGNFGPTVSEIGLGCWQLGGGDWGEVSDERALAILRASIEAEVRLLDTADVYGLGRSESLIGRYVRESGVRPFIATKLGRFPHPGGADNFSLATFRGHIDASLKRLGVDHLDLLQLHCVPTALLRSGEVFDWLRTLRAEGKIAGFGASVESDEEALICLAQPDIAALQIIFNIFRQKPIETVLEMADARGVAIIVRLPLASGLLTGKFDSRTTFASTDHRSYNRDGDAFNVGETFAGLQFETGVALANELRAFVPYNMTMAQMAIRWILDYPAVTTVIPGASSPEMAIVNAAVSDLQPLSPALHAKLAEFYRTKVAGHIRGPY